MAPILKPDTCIPCPLYKLSKYYTPDTIIPDSIVTILGQAPGAHEEHGLALQGYKYVKGKRQEIVQYVTPQPLIGASGNWLRKDFWPRTGLDYDSVSRANVIKCRPYGVNDLPNLANAKPVNGITVTQLKAAIEHCTGQHLQLPAGTTHVLAMGEVALYAMTGEELLHYRKYLEEDESSGVKAKRLSTVTEWRGWAVGKSRSDGSLSGIHSYYHPTVDTGSITVFPVVHLASLFEDETYYHATLMDFRRFGRLVRGEWPAPLPDIKVNILPRQIPEVIGFDTEYISSDLPNQSALTMFSMADLHHNIYVVDASKAQQLRGLPENLTVITQNGRVDLPHLRPLIPANWSGKLTVEDCMLGWAVVHSGEPTGLDYQLSLVGRYNRHKHLRQVKDQQLSYLYAGLDAECTLNDAWRYISHIFSQDTWLQDCYEKRRGRPLLPILERFESRGVEVHRERVELVKQLMDEQIDRINKEAQEITGIADFNIRSAGADGQVGRFLAGKPQKEKPVKVGRKKAAKQQMELL